MATKANAPVKRVRVTAKHVAEHREAQKSKASRDHTPNWEGSESWDVDKFQKQFYATMTYFRLEADSKAYKPIVLKWLTGVGAAKEDIAAFKKVKDSRVNSTMAGIANALMRGMPAQREDWNGGKNSAEWLTAAIVRTIDEGKDDVDASDTKKEEKPAAPVQSIQERTRDAAWKMTEEIEDALESFYADKDAFDPKAFKMLNLLRGKGVKAAHARIIKEFYGKQLAELQLLASGKADDQLKEGYSHLARKYVKKLIEFYTEIDSACNMLMEEAKVNRAPRVKKPTDKTKVVAKLKYKKQDEALKLVSINPVDIIGAKELWIYNSKTRKLGKYVAAEFADLGVKGTTIIGFDENKSIQKTLRKPADQIKAFKEAGKVALRKFLDDINSVDTKMNGRINEEIVLLKVA